MKNQNVNGDLANSITTGMRFDRCRGWVRNRINRGKSWEELRNFRPARAEEKLKEAIEDGDLDPLDGLPGDSLLDRWAAFVDALGQHDRKNMSQNNATQKPWPPSPTPSVDCPYCRGPLFIIGTKIVYGQLLIDVICGGNGLGGRADGEQTEEPCTHRGTKAVDFADVSPWRE